MAEEQTPQGHGLGYKYLRRHKNNKISQMAIIKGNDGAMRSNIGHRMCPEKNPCSNFSLKTRFHMRINRWLY